MSILDVATKEGRFAAARIAEFLNSDDKALVQHYVENAQIFAKKFKESYRGISDSQWQELEKIYSNSNDLRELIHCACLDAIFVIDNTSERGHPGHDKRHVLFDLSSAIYLAHHDNLSPIKQFALLIGSLLHDIGRLPETVLEEPGSTAQSGVIATLHPEIGAKIASDLCTPYRVAMSDIVGDSNLDLANRLFDEIIYSILMHQSGAINCGEIPQGVASADRDQLIGIESITRFMQFDVGLCGRTLKSFAPQMKKLLSAATDWKAGLLPTQPALPLPGKPEDTAFDSHALFYTRKLYPQYGALAKKAKLGTIVSLRFLWLTMSEEERELMFARELLGDECPNIKFFDPIASDLWSEVKDYTIQNDKVAQLSTGPLGTSDAAESFATYFLSHPHSAQYSEKVFNSVTNLFTELDDSQKERWFNATAYHISQNKLSRTNTHNLLELILSNSDSITPTPSQAFASYILRNSL